MSSTQHNRQATLTRCVWTRLDGRAIRIFRLMRSWKTTYCVTLWIFIVRETISRTTQEENASHVMCVPVCLYQILGKQTKEETIRGWSTSRDFQRSHHRDSPLSLTLSYTVWCWSWLPHLAPLYYANNLTAFQKRKKTRKNKQICLEEWQV